MTASRLALGALLCLALAGPALAAEKIGLVLSGGGARGLAHVGVLKVLERERIPVDVIAGTSMGAIIGGLYASGMSAAELERELLAIDWGRMFAARVDRQQLSQRRKEEDFAFSPVLEFGMRDGELRAPQATLSSRGLEMLLRRLTLPVRDVSRFDQLPTPFRAVATNMENGGQAVLDAGDLALAMRSSMSVPGVFAPTEWHEQILGDGGLVNNLPVDVARSLGAHRIIAVNVGTPLSGRAALNSLIGLTGQMINILTEQNVQRSLSLLEAGEDLLITPDLAMLTSSDFDKARLLIAAGEAAAEAMLSQLRPLAVDAERYADWRLARAQRSMPAPTLAAVVFDGSQDTRPAHLQRQLESQPGQPFDAARAERDARLLASSGDYERVDYHVQQRQEGGDALIFSMEDKTWGPNYFRVGLDLSTDFGGDSTFNLRVSHNRHWLTPSGTEWRNQATIGLTPRLYSELYQPLFLGRSGDWFASAWGEVERRNLDLYDRDNGRELARLRRQSATAGFDIGQPWGRLGEVRLGLVHQEWRITPRILSGDVADDNGVLDQRWRESGLRLKAVVDQLDFASFPQAGYRVEFEAVGGTQTGGPTVRHARFTRTELQATTVHSWRGHTLNLHARALVARQPEDSAQGPYSLGGFQQLSGYRPGQLTGNTLAFARATYYLRLRDNPVLTRGFFVGGSLETGNAWDRRSDASFSDLRWAASAFLGADTGVGPLYVALGRAPRGGTAVYLFIGRP